MKTLILAAAAVATLAAPLAASAQPFGRDGGGWSHAQPADFHGGDRFGDRGGYRGGNGGAVLAAGVFGLILGSAIASSHNYAYDRPYDYAPRCGWETRPYQDAYGYVHYGQVQVCR
jgi:hypothetical protein